jgi:hypothetical protein
MFRLLRISCSACLMSFMSRVLVSNVLYVSYLVCPMSCVSRVICVSCPLCFLSFVSRGLSLSVSCVSLSCVTCVLILGVLCFSYPVFLVFQVSQVLVVFCHFVSYDFWILCVSTFCGVSVSHTCVLVLQACIVLCLHERLLTLNFEINLKKCVWLIFNGEF